MANRLSQEKARAIATEYCTNGFKKVMALLAVGYSKSYANKVGLKLYDNDLVKSAVAKIQALAATQTGYTVAQAQEEYEEARLLAMRVEQPAAASTAVTGKARLYGMDKDAGGKEQTVIVISPKPVKQVENTVIDEERADNGM